MKTMLDPKMVASKIHRVDRSETPLDLAAIASPESSADVETRCQAQSTGNSIVPDSAAQVASGPDLVPFVPP